MSDRDQAIQLAAAEAATTSSSLPSRSQKAGSAKKAAKPVEVSLGVEERYDSDIYAGYGGKKKPDFITSLKAGVDYTQRLDKRSHLKGSFDFTENLYARNPRSDYQFYRLGLEGRKDGSILRLKYGYIPRYVLFPDSSGNTLFSKHLYGAVFRQKVSKRDTVSLKYEGERFNYNSRNDGRDAHSNAVGFELDHEFTNWLEVDGGYMFEFHRASDRNFSKDTNSYYVDAVAKPMKHVTVDGKLRYDHGGYLTSAAGATNRDRKDDLYIFGLGVSWSVTPDLKLRLADEYSRRFSTRAERSYSENVTLLRATYAF